MCFEQTALCVKLTHISFYSHLYGWGFILFFLQKFLFPIAHDYACRSFHEFLQSSMSRAVGRYMYARNLNRKHKTLICNMYISTWCSELV